MVSRNLIGALTLGLAVLFNHEVTALDQVCVTLANPVEEGATRLYYRQTGLEWSPLDDHETSLTVGANAQFIYVIREDRDSERPGVLVIKTGRTADRGVQRTTLKRNPQPEISNEPCGQVDDFKYNNSSVSSDSYDLYHDIAGSVPDHSDLVKIDNFHIRNYAGRKRRCRETNSTAWDSIWDHRSNRSQFSFDRRVVDEGIPIGEQVARFLNVGRAQASPVSVARRVEMRRYRTGTERVACVRFDLNIDGPGFFLRLNDIESHVRGGNARGKERLWTLSQ